MDSYKHILDPIHSKINDYMRKYVYFYKMVKNDNYKLPTIPENDSAISEEYYKLIDAKNNSHENQHQYLSHLAGSWTDEW